MMSAIPLRNGEVPKPAARPEFPRLAIPGLYKRNP